ncbi:MAG: diguanylate cyclase [Desulfobacterales bacterium]|nr:diguanylate cyclase [Desulfobacterales bacterium]
MKIKNNILLIILAWFLLAIISFFWNYTNGKKAQHELAFQTARNLFKHIETTRFWNTLHGGVYVPITAETQPNPYLKTEMKNIKINDKLMLTKVNPAFMTRQIAEIAMKRDGIKFHITSLKPIRPLNKPTLREAACLNDFEKGIAEVGYFIKNNAMPSFFYMAPLKTEEECLQCHAVQGYKTGDIRGGISIFTPYEVKISTLPLILGHVGIWFVGVVGIIFAGNKLNRAYATIRKQALFDSLTEIPNRRNFSDNIAVEFMRSKRDKNPISLIMCDIDNFKAYNDTYGHSKGDACLKKVAQGIKNSLKRPSDFCARYGGEEFIVLLPDTSLNGVKHVAEKIRSNIEKMKIPHKNSLPAKIVTLSLGVTTSDGVTLDSNASHEKLIRHADIAMYKAKEKGKNQVV